MHLYIINIKLINKLNNIKDKTYHVSRLRLGYYILWFNFSIKSELSFKALCTLDPLT